MGVTQALMRHRDPKLTQKIYVDQSLLPLADAAASVSSVSVAPDGVYSGSPGRWPSVPSGSGNRSGEKISEKVLDSGYRNAEHVLPVDTNSMPNSPAQHDLEETPRSVGAAMSSSLDVYRTQRPPIGGSDQETEECRRQESNLSQPNPADSFAKAMISASAPASTDEGATLNAASPGKGSEAIRASSGFSPGLNPREGDALAPSQSCPPPQTPVNASRSSPGSMYPHETPAGATASTRAAGVLSVQSLLDLARAASERAQVAHFHKETGIMRTHARLAAAAALCAVSALAVPPDLGRGWTSGKACHDANGCGTRNTLSACIACCDFFCAGVFLDCVDACTGGKGQGSGNGGGGIEGDVIRSLNLAAMRIERGQATLSDITLIETQIGSPVRRIRTVATALAQESSLSSIFAEHLDQGQGSL